LTESIEPELVAHVQNVTPPLIDDVVDCSDPSAIRLWAWQPPGAFAPDCAIAILQLIGGPSFPLRACRGNSRAPAGRDVHNFREFPLEIFEQIDMRQPEENSFLIDRLSPSVTR
jgi:hypothetical protein